MIHFLHVSYCDRLEVKKLGAIWHTKLKKWYFNDQNIDSSVFGKWLENPIINQASPVEDFTNVLIKMGAIITGVHPIGDGNRHRLAHSSDTKGKKSISYVFHLDENPCGVIINFKADEKIKWVCKNAKLNINQEKILIELKEKQRLHQKKIIEHQQKISNIVKSQINNMNKILQLTPYHLKKQIKIHRGIYSDFSGKTIFIPLFDISGKIWSLQKISANGNKRFFKGGKTTGVFNLVGGFIKKLPIYKKIILCEGYATACSLYEMSTTHPPILACMTAHNLMIVAKAVRNINRNAQIIIAGDNDQKTFKRTGINIGMIKAKAAAKAVGGCAIFPQFTQEQQHLSDFNDWFVAKNRETRVQPTKDSN